MSYPPDLCGCYYPCCINFIKIIHAHTHTLLRVYLYISNRVHKAQIWQKAVDWIANSETRVRVESQMIAGEQFTVWRWIHSDPPATEVKFLLYSGTWSLLYNGDCNNIPNIFPYKCMH